MGEVDSRIQGFRDSGLQGFRDSGSLGFGHSGIQGFRDSLKRRVFMVKGQGAKAQGKVSHQRGRLSPQAT